MHLINAWIQYSVQPQKCYNTNTTTNHALNHACCDIILITIYLVTLNYPRMRKMKKQLIIFSRLTLLKEDPQVTINVCPTNKTSIKINNEA